MNITENRNDTYPCLVGIFVWIVVAAPPRDRLSAAIVSSACLLIATLFGFVLSMAIRSDMKGNLVLIPITNIVRGENYISWIQSDESGRYKLAYDRNKVQIHFTNLNRDEAAYEILPEFSNMWIVPWSYDRVIHFKELRLHDAAVEAAS